MTLVDHTIDFIRTTTWDDLPHPVQHQARRCLLDALGALIAGTQTPVGRIMREYVSDQYAGDDATVLVSGQRVSAVGAALANGFAGNALDIDDGYRRIKGHPGACVLPAVLAASEYAREPIVGTTLLTALVVGYEVGIRAGLIRHATHTTYHSSGSWGAIAAAAAAGRLLDLDTATLRHALGAADYHAPIAPMMRGIATPSMGKDSIGWGAMVGLASVLMARRGFTGIDPLFAEAPDPSWVWELGRTYEIQDLYFKPYACCRWAQPAVAGALDIARQHNLTPDDVARIRVTTFSEAAAMKTEPPRSTEDAQYHLAYPVAAALIDGEVGPRQVTPPRICDETLLALASRVETTVAEAYDDAFPAKAYADVAVITRDGSTFIARRKEALWEPPDTLPSDDELERKFRWLVTPVLREDRTNALVEQVWAFDTLDNARAVIDDAIV